MVQQPHLGGSSLVYAVMFVYLVSVRERVSELIEKNLVRHETKFSCNCCGALWMKRERATQKVLTPAGSILV